MKKNVTLPSQKVIATFYTLIGTFLFLLAMLFVPAIQEMIHGPIFLVPPFIFFLLGILLTIFTLKEKVKGKLKKFFLLTGLSAAGFFVGIILHNAFYALGILTQNILLLNKLFEVLHVIFFFISIPISPVGFIIGTLGVTIELVRK